MSKYPKVYISVEEFDKVLDQLELSGYINHIYVIVEEGREVAVAMPHDLYKSYQNVVSDGELNPNTNLDGLDPTPMGEAANVVSDGELNPNTNLDGLDPTPMGEAAEDQ